MKNFKIGDEVYYFWHDSDCSLIWNLDEFSIKKEIITKIDILNNPMFGNGYVFDKREPFYKSKNEAIDAMIKHLEGMKE